MARQVIPPPYVITEHDKRGLIVVTGASVLAFVWCCSLIRVWLRWQLKEWRSDDWWLSVATLLDTVQTGIILHLVSLGLGGPEDDIPLLQREQLGREGFATQIIYIVVILASKLSILLLHLRISPGGCHRISARAIIALSCIWAIVSVVLVSVPCNPTEVFANPDSCTNRWPKWLAISTLDIITEFLIFSTAIQLVHYLQMQRSVKFMVIFAFSARLPVIAIAAVRLYFIHQRVNGSYTFDYLLATQWQMGYAIMSCTITGLGPFLKPFDKEYVQSYHHQGHSSTPRSAPSQHMTSSTASSILPPRRQARKNQDNISESYLMDTLPSRNGSKRTTPEEEEQEEAARRSSSSPDRIPTPAAAATDSSNANAPAPPTTMLTADEFFRPIHLYRGHETEVWVGERSPSLAQEELANRMQQGSSSGGGANKRPNLIIGKKKEFKIEVDRASRVV